jgi:hypothetical protein
MGGTSVTQVAERTESEIPRHKLGLKQSHPRWIRPARLIAGCLVAYAAILTALLAMAPHVTAPDEKTGMSVDGGGIGVATHQLLGRPGGTDFLIDYASAHALVHHDDAYDISERLVAKVGSPWPVSTANPHPPTLLVFILPFLFAHYETALTAWALAMIFVLALTVRLLGISWPLSGSAGIAIAVTFPGSYGISNPVPLIGLGIALAYRFRHEPVIAGLGICIAAAPKVSGLLLFAPFLLGRRIKAVLIGAAAFLILAVAPIAFQHDVWSRYLDKGVYAANANAGRDDNASLLYLGTRLGMPRLAPIVILGILALLAVVVTRDGFWPSAWLMVAALPIAWMYSLLTLVPLGFRSSLRNSRITAPVAIVAAGLAIGSPPGGKWPLPVFPTVVLLVYAQLLASGRSDDDGFWTAEWTPAMRRQRRANRSVAMAPTGPDVAD